MNGYTVVVVPGLFGGKARKYYEPLAGLVGTDEFYLFRAGEDWEPTEIAEDIRRIEGKKKVICLSCGAMVGNLLANDTDTEVYYLCPYLGVEFINRFYKSYAYKLRHLFKALACILMVLSRPFKRHRWYPLFGGTKPDGWFLSIYAIAKQLKYAFSKALDVQPVNGVVYSYGDRVVDPFVAATTSENAVPAWTVGWTSPAHCNLREEGEEFGKFAVSGNGTLGEDAKAYLRAFAQMLRERPH